MKEIVKMGLHSHLANLPSGFQAAHQFPFMSQHQTEQLHGKEDGVGVLKDYQNNQSMDHLPHI
eukprot:7975188-Ditylum_brightwellii.AAC.1